MTTGLPHEQTSAFRMISLFSQSGFVTSSRTKSTRNVQIGVHKDFVRGVIGVSSVSISFNFATCAPTRLTISHSCSCAVSFGVEASWLVCVEMQASNPHHQNAPVNVHKDAVRGVTSVSTLISRMRYICKGIVAGIKGQRITKVNILKDFRHHQRLMRLHFLYYTLALSTYKYIYSYTLPPPQRNPYNAAAFALDGPCSSDPASAAISCSASLQPACPADPSTTWDSRLAPRVTLRPASL